MCEDYASISLDIFSKGPSLSLIFLNNVSTPRLSIPSMGTLTCSIHTALLPRRKRGQPECKSASAKIERFEAQAMRKVCNDERRARRVRWTFYVDGNMTKAMTHGWAVGVRSSIRHESSVPWIETTCVYGYLPPSPIFAPLQRRKMCAERKQIDEQW